MAADPPSRSNLRLTLPARMRLSHARQFEMLRRRGWRANSGPLSVSALPNELSHCRFGLSVPARVGTAVKRARIKRLIRESLRLMQHDLPGGYDLLFSVRPHDTLTLSECQQHLADAIRSIDRTWQKKKQAGPDRGSRSG
jgi:ribonuclease P protein component